MTKLYRGEKIGEGTYGVVYSATKETPLRPLETVAVKRNFMDISASFSGNIRELDTLSRLKGHPFVVNLQNVSFGDPFCIEGSITPVKIEERKMKDDSIHFIMEYVPISLSNLITSTNTNYTMHHAKILMAQLLIATEWMHAKGVAHRDFKPANILVSVDTTGPRLRICDFGMSQVLGGALKSTPGVTTSWYRSAEICTASKYGLKADMWAIGCIMFEMVSGWPFLYGAIDSDVGAFNAILGRLPNNPDQKVIQALFDDGKILPITPEASPIRRKSFEEQLKLTDKKIKEFDIKPGSVKDFIDLLSKILVIDPIKRLNATQALEHPFFSWLKTYIEGFRKAYPPVYPDLPVINIVQCVERQFMINLAFTIYNHRHRIIWYSHRILFHAIDLFDRYLEYEFSNNSNLKDGETQLRGRLHTKSECELRFYVCMYLMHKYYNSMSLCVEWSKFTSEEFTTNNMMIVAEQFETHLIREVTKFNIYRDTLLEVPHQYNHEITDNLINDILHKYGNITSYNEGSIRNLYRIFMNISKPLSN